MMFRKCQFLYFRSVLCLTYALQVAKPSASLSIPCFVHSLTISRWLYRPSSTIPGQRAGRLPTSCQLLLRTHSSSRQEPVNRLQIYVLRSTAALIGDMIISSGLRTGGSSIGNGRTRLGLPARTRTLSLCVLLAAFSPSLIFARRTA